MPDEAAEIKITSLLGEILKWDGNGSIFLERLEIYFELNRTEERVKPFLLLNAFDNSVY